MSRPPGQNPGVDREPERLPHGYTNRTSRVSTSAGRVVQKAYDGPDAPARRDRERAMLAALAGRVPVPPLLDGDGTRDDGTPLRMGFVAGVPAQELLAPAAGRDTATAVLTACGRVLGRVHAVDLNAVDLDAVAPGLGAPVDAPGAVLVHGDFGPNNLLLDPSTMAVTAVLDWEFAHVGTPVEDLAWCEWIVRMHHPDRVDLLDAFFRAYGGEVPDWPLRRHAMLARCAELLDFCVRWDPDGGGVTQWKQRLAETRRWET